jgi:uncharacterized protein YecE (DUF72 family)
MEWRIGCSGWSYQHWRGNFYPEGLKPDAWLKYYAGVFDTVEINNTFYRLPTEAAVRSWRERAPEGFRYAVKASRLITHRRRLATSAAAIDVFFARLLPLGERLGPFLFQFPSFLERDDEELKRFIDLLPATPAGCAFEFRHASWWREDVFDLLRERGIMFCIYHAREMETPVVATGDGLYVRFHGTAAGYGGAYGRSRLASWRQRLAEAGRGCRTAWVYFNNDVGGQAPRDARLLQTLVGARQAARSISGTRGRPASAQNRSA